MQHSSPGPDRQISRSQVFSALERLRTANVGFADAFLAAGGMEEKVAVASFDRDLDKFKDVKRYEPRA